MLNVAQALDIILSSVAIVPRELLSLSDAHRRILADAVIASEDIPPFDNSAVDGYAVRFEDVSSPSVILNIVGEVGAGETTSPEVRTGEAVRIMTGGKVPAGANAVVPVEGTEPVDPTHVRVSRAISLGQNIRRAGEDIQKGERVLNAGLELRAAELGVLASLGRKSVEVYRRPRAAFLATGNELIDVDEPLQGGKIRNSNSYTLRALIEEAGAIPLDLGIARDDAAELRAKLLKGFDAEALITSGGVSVGRYDLVQEVLEGLGVEIKFWKVNMKPGMPFLFGMYHTTPVFGLPGNPVSTMVTFLQLVRPALRRMMGVSVSEKRIPIRAELAEDIEKTDGKRHFLRGVAETRNGILTVRTTETQSSGVLTSLVKANCLIVVPEDTDLLRSGDFVEIEFL
jgi:molybdopterin molybdotransferase